MLSCGYLHRMSLKYTAGLYINVLDASTAGGLRQDIYQRTAVASRPHVFIYDCRVASRHQIHLDQLFSHVTRSSNSPSAVSTKNTVQASEIKIGSRCSILNDLKYKKSLHKWFWKSKSRNRFLSIGWHPAVCKTCNYLLLFVDCHSHLLPKSNHSVTGWDPWVKSTTEDVYFAL